MLTPEVRHIFRIERPTRLRTWNLVRREYQLQGHMSRSQGYVIRLTSMDALDDSTALHTHYRTHLICIEMPIHCSNKCLQAVSNSLWWRTLHTVFVFSKMASLRGLRLGRSRKDDQEGNQNTQESGMYVGSIIMVARSNVARACRPLYFTDV